MSYTANHFIGYPPQRCVGCRAHKIAGTRQQTFYVCPFMQWIQDRSDHTPEGIGDETDEKDPKQNFSIRQPCKCIDRAKLIRGRFTFAQRASDGNETYGNIEKSLD